MKNVVFSDFLVLAFSIVLCGFLRVAFEIGDGALAAPLNSCKISIITGKWRHAMSGHGEHHEEDSSVPMKVGIFLICMIAMIAVVATL